MGRELEQDFEVLCRRENSTKRSKEVNNGCRKAWNLEDLSSHGSAMTCSSYWVWVWMAERGNERSQRHFYLQSSLGAEIKISHSNPFAVHLPYLAQPQFLYLYRGNGNFYHFYLLVKLILSLKNEMLYLKICCKHDVILHVLKWTYSLKIRQNPHHLKAKKEWYNYSL